MLLYPNFGIIVKNLDYGSTQDLWKNATYSYTATTIGHFQLMVGDSTVPSITVTSPNDGEILSESNYTITWIASDGSGLESLDLAYSTDNGMTYTPIATLDKKFCIFSWILLWLINSARSG